MAALGDPRVDRRIQDVQQEVDQHDRRAGEDHDPGHHRDVDVAAGDRLHGLVPEPREPEDGLDVDRDAEGRAHVHPDHGQDRQPGVRERVPPDDSRLGGALRPRGADVGLPEDLDHPRPDDPRVERHEEEREADPGQDQVLRPVGRAAAGVLHRVADAGEERARRRLREQRAVAGDGEDLPALGEEELHDQREHERVRRDPGERDGGDRAVDQRVRLGGGDRAERDRDQQQHDRAAEDERRGHPRRLPELAADRLTRDVLTAHRQPGGLPVATEVGVREPPHPLLVLDVDRPVGAEQVPRVGDLLRRGALHVDQEPGRLGRDLHEQQKGQEREQQEQDEQDQEPPDEERERRHQRRPLGIERGAEALAEQVERERGEEDREARDQRRPDRERERRVAVLLEQRAPGGGQHRAPARGRELHADVEEAQARLEHHVGRDQDGRVGDQRGRDVGDEVTHEDAPVLRADHLRRLDEVALLQRQHLRAHDPGRVEPRERADQQDQHQHALVEQAAERDRVDVPGRDAAEHQQEEQEREAHHQVDHARDDRVDPAAEEARRRAEQGADQDREHRPEQRDLERDAPAVEQPQQLVAAERAVGAEDEQRVRRALRRRRQADDLVGGDLDVVDGRHVRPRPRRLQVHVDGVGKRVVGAVAEQRTGDRRAGADGQEQEDDEAEAEDRRAVAPQAAEGDPPGPGWARGGKPVADRSSRSVGHILNAIAPRGRARQHRSQAGREAAARSRIASTLRGLRADVVLLGGGARGGVRARER